MGLPFRTKASNLVYLNVVFILWFAILVVAGVFVCRDAVRTHSFHDLWGILGMLAFGAIFYVVQRLFLHFAYCERPKATEADIAEARRMLYEPSRDGEGKQGE